MTHTQADNAVHVLNGGYIRLVEHMGGDLGVVRAARNTHNAAWRTGLDAGKDAGLLKRLMFERHTSPIEFAEFVFDVKLPIFVIRQWHRHRTWNYSEISARYAELPEDFYVPGPGRYTVQSKHDKQACLDAAQAFGVDFERAKLELKWEREQTDIMALVFGLYKRHLEQGMSREQARIILPMATYTRMFAKVDLHNLFHFLNLRLSSHAQYEIRVYAEAIMQLIEPVVPELVKVYERWRATRME